MDPNTIIDINKTALNYHISAVDRVKKICEPLKHLGIDTFGYLKIFDDARYLHICNQDEWSQYYFKNIHDDGETFTKSMSLVVSKVSTYLWPTETTDYLLLDLRSNKIWNGFTFYKRTDDYIENWSFATHPDNHQVHMLYLKHQDLLWKFVQYFNTQAADLINHSDTSKLAIYKNGINLEATNNILSENSINDFLNEIKLKKFIIKNNNQDIFLSSREKQCIELIARGLTHKAIAREINVSPRTVGSYIDNVRLKLGVHNKLEIIKLYEKSLIGD